MPITTGAILIEEGTALPDSMLLESEPYSTGWTSVTNLDRRGPEDGQMVPLDVKVGNRILFVKYSGNDVKLEGEEYLAPLGNQRIRKYLLKQHADLMRELEQITSDLTMRNLGRPAVQSA
jgi:co-chaperonin GroES (HSP10)